MKHLYRKLHSSNNISCQLKIAQVLLKEKVREIDQTKIVLQKTLDIFQENHADDNFCDLIFVFTDPALIDSGTYFCDITTSVYKVKVCFDEYLSNTIEIIKQHNVNKIFEFSLDEIEELYDEKGEAEECGDCG